MGIYRKAKEAADHVVTWAGLFGVLAALLAWLSSKVPPMSGVGWAGFTLIGVAMACIVTLSLAGILSAWRFFNPIASGLGARATTETGGNLNNGNRWQQDAETRFNGIDGTIARVRSDLKNEIKELNGGFDAILEFVLKPIRSQIDALQDQVGGLEERLEYPPNLGNTLGEALTNAEQARLSQLERIREEIDPIRTKVTNGDRESSILLEWANARIARMAFRQTALEVPQLDEGAPPADPEERAKAINLANEYISKVRNLTAGMVLDFNTSAVIENCKAHGHHVLRNLEPPHQMHALDFADYYVPIVTAKRLAVFLEEQACLGDRDERVNYLSIVQQLIRDRQRTKGL
jgi:hypothetical protein